MSYALCSRGNVGIQRAFHTLDLLPSFSVSSIFWNDPFNPRFIIPKILRSTNNHTRIILI